MTDDIAAAVIARVRDAPVEGRGGFVTLPYEWRNALIAHIEAQDTRIAALEAALRLAKEGSPSWDFRQRSAPCTNSSAPAARAEKAEAERDAAIADADEARHHKRIAEFNEKSANEAVAAMEKERDAANALTDRIDAALAEHAVARAAKTIRDGRS